jgi:hypothetical protein
MSLPKLISLLHTGQLFFTQLGRFEDHYEGSLPGGSIVNAFAPLITEPEIERSSNWPNGSIQDRAKAIEAMLTRSISMVRNCVYVNCWHLSDGESAAMWNQYGEEGIAIQSTFSRLRDCVDADPSTLVTIGTVQYMNYKSAASIVRSAFDAAFTKRSSFSYEQELRVALTYPAWDDDGKLDYNLQPPGRGLPISVEGLIETLYVAPKCPKWIRSSIEELLRRFDFPNIQVEQSRLDDSRLI